MAAFRKSVISLHFQAGDGKREAGVEHPTRGTAVSHALLVMPVSDSGHAGLVLPLSRLKNAKYNDCSVD